MDEGPTDEWSEWLLHRRQGGDAAFGAVVRGAVAACVERVLDGAALAPGMTLADIGAGEGLLSFRAIERVGPGLSVILTDISAPMLRYAANLAAQRHVMGQCRFLECAADALRDLADSSVDVTVTRAVLAYVADKGAALAEFHRILKPGGRLSLAEPIFQDEAFFTRALKARLDAAGPASADRLLPLLYRWKAAQFPATEALFAASPLVNYSERDLLNLVRGAGFCNIHLELHIDVVPSLVTSWDVFLESSPHPWAPPLSVILRDEFTAEERQFFEQTVRPTVEGGNNISTDRVVYVTAEKSRA